MQTAKRMSLPNRANISNLAYELWEEAGRPVGRQEEFWLEAKERLLITQHSNASAHLPAPAVGWDPLSD